jgi:hypothetical protein
MRAPSLAPLLATLPLLAACARADRIELQPSTVRFVGVGKSTDVHATPYERNGLHHPDPPCAWTSSDEKVVKVAGRGNDATLTTVAPGTAAVRCTIGSAVAELPVTVRVVSRIAVRPDRAELTVAATPAPLVLSVDAFDDQGAPVASRSALVACQDEGVCRGDARGQVWPVGPGQTTARVEVEGASLSLPVKVVEGRSAGARPQAYKGKGNYAEEIERQYNERLKAEERARLGAEKKGKR